MNALTGSQPETPEASSIAVTMDLHTLRRTGRKALRFSGHQIVEAKGAGFSHDDGASLWYDLSIYRSAAQAVIVELIARRTQLSEQDMFRAESFPTLQDAAAWLENYACAQDVPIPAALAVGAGPMAMSVLQAVQLRQRIARIHDEYQGLLSDVFEALDITDDEPQPGGSSMVDAAV